jgi:hypothetical protein
LFRTRTSTPMASKSRTIWSSEILHSHEISLMHQIHAAYLGPGEICAGQFYAIENRLEEIAAGQVRVGSVR